MKASELVGSVGGWALAPVTSAVAAVRRTRMFHPDGVVIDSMVEPVAEGDFKRLAERLSGRAIVRLSSAWWKGGKEWPDDLGLAMRFRTEDEVDPLPASGDQDLLFATVRSPWTTVLAVLTTNVHDFLANDYYAVSPFQVQGYGRLKFRMVSSRPQTGGNSRVERLESALRGMGALFTLEAKHLGGKYQPLCKVRLSHEVRLDQRELRFDPFKNGRGITPVGLVHKLRKGAYAGSQKIRRLIPQQSQSAI